VTVDLCPACGYPQFGSGVCAACRPVAMQLAGPTGWYGRYASVHPGAGTDSAPAQAV
jgi:hypothetical protein